MLHASSSPGMNLAGSPVPPAQFVHSSKSSAADPTQTTGAKLVGAKRSKRRHLVNVSCVGRAVAELLVAGVNKVEGEVSRKVGKTAGRLKNACMQKGLAVVQGLRPALNNVPAADAATAAAQVVSSAMKPELDVDIAQMRACKKSLKSELPKLKATIAKAGRLQAAAQKHRSDAQSRLETGCVDLCRDLSGLSMDQALKRNGQAGDGLVAVFHKVKKTVKLAAGPTGDEIVKAMDRLWKHERQEARADILERELGKRRKAADRASCLEAAIDESRALQEQGRALKRASSAAVAAWTEAKLAFEGGHMETCQAILQEKQMIDGLPNPNKQGWITDVSARLDLPEPSPAIIKASVKNQIARSLRTLPDGAFDNICRGVAPGGYMGPMLVHGDHVKVPDILDILRGAAQDERVRRYETDPLHALAELSELIEANAIEGMSARGLNADQVALPEHGEHYLHARKAIHGLLRGMCLAKRGDEGRTEYVSRLIMEGADPADREKLLRNTTWMQPAVFKALMDHIQRITPNADLMGSQYQRLLQEMQVVLKGNVLAASAGRGQPSYRRLSDYDHLDGALPRKARGVIRQGWDKVKFWGGYALLGNGVEKEAKHFAYLQSHVDKRLRAWVDLMSRYSADSREVRRAYRDFLNAADDLRVEFNTCQFRDTACDEYLRLEFSRTVGSLGAEGIKNLYKNLQQQCPDMRSRAPRFAFFSDLQGWWRNKFWQGDRAMPRDSIQWQRTAARCWTELRTAVEQEPEARNYAYQLQSLAGKFDRHSGKDYEGMKAALDRIIKCDGTTWSSPSAGSFTAYDAAWARIDPKLMTNLLDRLTRYEHRMDDFLKADAVTGTIAEENRFMYRYTLEGLRKSCKDFMENNPMNRYAKYGAAAIAEDASAEIAEEAVSISTATVPPAAVAV